MTMKMLWPCTCTSFYLVKSNHAAVLCKMWSNLYKIHVKKLWWGMHPFCRETISVWSNRMMKEHLSAFKNCPCTDKTSQLASGNHFALFKSVTDVSLLWPAVIWQWYSGTCIQMIAQNQEWFIANTHEYICSISVIWVSHLTHTDSAKTESSNILKLY